AVSAFVSLLERGAGCRVARAKAEHLRYAPEGRGGEAGWPQVQERRAGLRRRAPSAGVARSARPDRVTEDGASRWNELLNVRGPEFEGPALFVHVLMKVIGLVANALRLVV